MRDEPLIADPREFILVAPVVVQADLGHDGEVRRHRGVLEADGGEPDSYQIVADDPFDADATGVSRDPAQAGGDGVAAAQRVPRRGSPVPRPVRRSGPGRRSSGVTDQVAGQRVANVLPRGEFPEFHTSPTLANPAWVQSPSRLTPPYAHRLRAAQTAADGTGRADHHARLRPALPDRLASGDLRTAHGLVVPVSGEPTGGVPRFESWPLKDPRW